jgi:SAM-dependent methyltransferase
VYDDGMKPWIPVIAALLACSFQEKKPEDEERPVKMIEALDLKGGEVVADLGAGSGYFTFRLAAKVGKVLAVDIQDKMVDAIRKRAAELRITNVEPITCTETDPKLPEQGAQAGRPGRPRGVPQGRSQDPDQGSP